MLIAFWHSIMVNQDWMDEPLSGVLYLALSFDMFFAGPLH
jgi:hypothetical protein